MVTTTLVDSVLKGLEKNLVKMNDFRLLGENYDLILFIPSEKYTSGAKYSLVLSYKGFNKLSQREAIKSILNTLKESLRNEEYNEISRINLIHSEDAFVKNLKYMFNLRESVMEINNVVVGGINIEYGFLMKPLILDKLVEGRALVLEVLDENNLLQTINAGIIRIEKNFDVVYYTGKGLREIWGTAQKTQEEKDVAENLKNESEEFLISHSYINKINIDKILKVLS